MNTIKIFIYSNLLVLLFISSLSAKTNVIYASHKYIMGDNDSKNDARKLCFIEAKRKILEKIGVFIESETKITNYKLTKDEIRTYSAALIKIEVVKEEIKFIGESIAIFVIVKAEVDSDRLLKDLIKIKENKSLQAKVKIHQRQIDDLENKIKELQKHLKYVSSEKAINLRKERNIIFREIDKLEKIKFEIQEKTNSAIEKITSGMTIKEVIDIVGQPRARTSCLGSTFLSYGKIWVWLEDGIVKGYIPIELWEGRCGFYDNTYKKFR